QNARWRCFDGELLAFYAIVDLTPAERRRHAGIIARAGAVGGRERLAGNVLEVVDVDAVAARPHCALDGRDLRVLAGDDGRDDLAEEEPRVVRRSRGQRDVDVQAVGAGGFRDAGRADELELVANPPRDVEHPGERDVRHRI